MQETRSLRQNFEALKTLAEMVDPIVGSPALQALPATDVRRVALGALQKTLAAHAAMVHALYWDRTVEQVETALSVVRSDRMSTARMVDDEIRGGVIDNVFFVVDALLANLTRSDPQLREERSFKLNVGRWFRLAGLTDVDRKIATMLAIAGIRNSRHNNGFHQNETFETVIRGKQFEFLRDRPVQCAGWGHLEAAVAGMLEVLGEFLVSPYVVAIPFTQDRYAAAVESGQIME